MIKEFHALVDSYELEIFALEESISRIKNLHKISTQIGLTNSCDECWEIYPCKTIRALNGSSKEKN